MSHNFLMLTSDKSEVIVLGPKHIRDLLSSNIVNLDGMWLFLEILTLETQVKNTYTQLPRPYKLKKQTKQLNPFKFPT